MTTASQLIHSNKEVNVPLGLTEKKTCVLCGAGFSNRPHFYFSLHRRSSAAQWFKSRQCTRVN